MQQSLQLRSNHAMHCHVCYRYVLLSIQTQFRDINFKLWIPVIQKLHIYVSKDAKIHGNFFKPNGSTSRNIWLTMYYIVLYKVQDGHEHGISHGSSEIYASHSSAHDDSSLLLDPEDAGTMFHQKLSNYLPVDTPKHNRKLETSSILNPFLKQDTLDFASK